MSTKRPISPAAEEILGGYFPVLDHGYVSLVDYMGSDEDIERAARVSYGHGTRKTSQTRGLIRYLRRHHHTTPSEMVELKFHCVMPIFVARQWIRHRTACLAEGTEIHFDLPGGMGRGGNHLYKLRIEEIWARTRPDRQGNPFFRRDRLQEMRLRQVNEDTGRIQHTRIVGVFRNSPRPVFRMSLADGRTIECTADHRFLFAGGWRTLAHATGLRESKGRAVWEAGDHYIQVSGLTYPEPAMHQDRASGWTSGITALHRSIADIAEDGGVTYHTSGRPLVGEAKPEPTAAWNQQERSRLVRVQSFEYVGVKETYDLEVEGPHHNFVANGIITHNSVNELSARYSLMPLLFYRPTPDQFALQSRSNKQGRKEGAPPAVYDEAVRRWETLRAEAGGAYAWMLEEDVARELARIDLPLSTYTQWYWKIDLHNLLHFLTLRVDPRAQWEIQEFARVMAAMVKRVAPLSYEAWVDYDLCARPFTRAERGALARLVRAEGEQLSARDGAELSKEELAELGLSNREIAELVEKLAAPERPDFELDLTRMRSAKDVGQEMALAVPGTKFE